ncbi:interferon-like [Zonotrichia leucophrys gambelii]|uniref:interferon-like n=1 Tax=Zonotrichia leucophrys gambelii TaxID=257770 RepID=UPI00314077AE
MAAPGCSQPHRRHSTLALLLLILALATGLPCHHLRTHDPGNALQHLQDMAPRTTLSCNLQKRPFFPASLLHNNLQPHQAAATALRILQHLFHTLSSNSTRQHWPSHARNHLLNKLQHHIHHLEQCLPDNAAPFKGPRNPLLAINKYFRDIHLFLHAHNHSACAWDHVRLEALVCFQHVDRLIRQMKHQAALDPTKPTDSKHPSPASTSGLRWSGDGSSPGWDHLGPVTHLPTEKLMGKGV